MTDIKKSTPQQFEDQLLAREEEGRVRTDVAKKVRSTIASTPKLSSEAKYRRLYDEAFEEAFAGIEDLPKTGFMVQDLQLIKKHREEYIAWVEMDLKGGLTMLDEKGGYKNAGFMTIRPKNYAGGIGPLIRHDPEHNLLQIGQHKVTKKMAALLMATGLFYILKRASESEPKQENRDQWVRTQAQAHEVEMGLANHMTQGAFMGELSRLPEAAKVSTVEQAIELEERGFIPFSGLDKVLFDGEQSLSKAEKSARGGFYQTAFLHTVATANITDPMQGFNKFVEALKQSYDQRKFGPGLSK